MENEDWSGDCQTTENEAQVSDPPEINQVIPGYTNFKDYIQEAYDAIKFGIKAANNLPTGSNFKYYACFPSFLKAKNSNTDLLLNAMQDILGKISVKGSVVNRDIEEKFELLIEANDILQDRANALMDEECGITKKSEVELVVTHAKTQQMNGSWNSKLVSSTSQKTSQDESSICLLAGKNVHRPQLSFKDKIDNSLKPWCPRIKDKPNSRRPLAIYLEEGENGEVFCHPYEHELEMFVIPNDQLEKTKPLMYKPLKDTKLIMIKDPPDIKLLLDDLKEYKEIAVDLEHHSYRSFQGITCLMQISTRDTDYVIDTLSLRSELHELNEIFTKPTILKVLHGADLDIQWLQRDLSLYIVNMFDTHQAAKQLNLPYLSLAYLLKTYCNVDPNKHFQMADWRIRPLPEQLLKYAREDTHYLLYIKDILTNALIDAANGQSNILKAVYDRSTDICKKTYVKPVWTEESFMNMYKKSNRIFNNKQLYALRELHKWRDQTAREEDDSIGYVLPNHMLLNIADTLPREMQGILACCDSIPPLVRQNLLKLHKIILKAREQPLIKTGLEELKQRLTQRNVQTASSKTWTSHDIPSGMEARADLPCLLDNGNKPDSPISLTATEHTVTVFDDSSTSENEDEDRKSTGKKKFVFVSPFERYKRVIPMVAEEESRERERQKQEEERANKLTETESQGEDRELKEKDTELEESKNRVHEHFKKVAKRKLFQTPLSQMEGRKKKRDSNINKQETERYPEQKPLSSIPSLKDVYNESTLRVAGYLTRLDDVADLRSQEGREMSDMRASNDETINPMRSRGKGEKKRVMKQLKQKGMMPSDKFNYNTIDFSSFQGGSKNSINQTNFDQTVKKKKEKSRRRKNRVRLDTKISRKMQLSVIVFVELSLLFVAHSHIVSEEDRNVDKNSSSYISHLTDFIFDLSSDSEVDGKSHQVDCLGLGKTVASALEWFFMSNPNGTNALEMQFLLSSRKQPQRVKVIIGKQFGLEWTDFQIERKTIIIVHGFLSHGQEPWISNLEKAFLRWGDVNVVVVDWSAGGNTWNYYKAAVNTKVVGYQISRFLEHIENATYAGNNSDKIVWGSIYLVGHSLGAHICGFTAKELKKRHSPWKVERITGLDPAQPCFKNADPAVKLAKSDAPFVDVIHTNGKLLHEIGLGLPGPIGHVDFYPNGGKSQPACIKSNSSYFSYLPVPIQVIDKSICSHGLSHHYLIESLVTDVKHNCTFWAHHWDLSYRNLFRAARGTCNRSICSEMGINAINYLQRGTFFVITADSAPFCVNNTRMLDEIIIHLEKEFGDHVDD
ncbi:exosome component 10 [Ceratina calcarata]|uniref:Exosome complex component 10 homolog n=1 Tax=Ceratina calcarata TaxID=156304 RepID=A0AAJ7JE08_9HYME|nr:exosome component 10 [Ceratina calcarata]